ncbi:MAG TPA: hypothetical protein VEA18_01870, partial [Candidatus Kapabacteria bacterium]|nr:hypothetical protein [Candidatus Kapabacteria bacterium]
MREASGPTSEPTDALLMKQCPLCQTPYAASAVTVLEKKEAVDYLHLGCTSCHSALLALVTRSRQGMGSIATLTDLTAEDARKNRHSEPFTSDDVLLFHMMLRTQAT